MAKATSAAKKVTKIVIRMYRAGTGDFFLLKFFAGTKHTFTLMIDCGCINAGKETFEPLLSDLETFAGNTIDLLVVTHQHADHINGFEKEKDKFDKLRFKRVWFAWTEDDEDADANRYRRTEGRMKLALQNAALRLKSIIDEPRYKARFDDIQNGAALYETQQNFVDTLTGLTELNSAGLRLAAAEIPTLCDLLKEWNVIKEDTVVEYLNPGDMIKNLEGATGLTFYVQGPPRDLKYIFMHEIKEEVFEKREDPSTVDFSFMNLFLGTAEGESDAEPFSDKFYVQNDDYNIRKAYEEHEWRKIDYDWLFSAGSLALKLYKNINNTSLAFAIQFDESEKVLFFPGDSELGCWMSWHDNLKWTSEQNGQSREITPEYLLNHAVFYKVSHHLSQNGTATKKGIDMMTSDELAAMATLDFDKILSGWLSTMPNDYLGAALIEKTKGKLFFVGNREEILKNIRTDRVNVRKTYVDKLNSYNKKFDGKDFIDCTITA